MAQALDKERQEYLDRLYPFLQLGQEPPGRWAPSEKLGGRLAGQGQIGWRTRLGEAIVAWSLGKPKGSRTRCTRTARVARLAIRLTTAPGNRLWIYAAGSTSGPTT